MMNTQAQSGRVIIRCLCEYDSFMKRKHNSPNSVIQ